MQDPNGWYNRQRSNTGDHLYPMQEANSATSIRAPDRVHGAQTLPAMYRDPFTSATSTTHGEVSRLSQPTFLISVSVTHRPALPPAGTSMPCLQPHYYSDNSYRYPSQNPPPYTEYATELNRPQSSQHIEGNSGHWPGARDDTLRYIGARSNRQVISFKAQTADYMRPHYLAITQSIIMANMCLTIPIHPIPPTYWRHPSILRQCIHFHIQRYRLRAYTPLPRLSHLPLTSARFLRRNHILSKSRRASLTTIWTNRVVSWNVHKRRSIQTHLAPRGWIEASACRDTPVLIPLNFHPASL